MYIKQVCCYSCTCADWCSGVQFSNHIFSKVGKGRGVLDTPMKVTHMKVTHLASEANGAGSQSGHSSTCCKEL